MSNRSITVTDAIYDYLTSVSLREPEIMRRLREETAAMPEHGMQTSPEQIQFFQLLVELLGVRRALEVGVFTGYSALGVALAMPPDGRLVALDNSEPYTAVARRYWAEAGVAERIELRLGAAIDTLERLIGEGESGRFDFAFIDADKPNYRGYYEHCLVLLRPGGLLAVDNVLWEGKVADATVTDENTEAIRVFNARISGDERVTLSMLPVGDGLTLARKR